MTNLEMEETEKVLQIDRLKQQNYYKIDNIQYTYRNNKIYVTGDIPVNVIQELAMEYSDSTCFFSILLSVDKSDGKFLKRIEISTIEEFILLFSYMEDYNLAKRGLSGNSRDLCDDRISEVMERVSKKVDLTITNEDWMIKKKCYDNYYKDYLKRINKKPLIKTEKSMQEYDYNLNIRNNINSFDMSVNPYLNVDKKLKSMKDIRTFLNISIDNLNLNNEGAMLKIGDKNTKNYVMYTRNSNSFSYEISYIFRKEKNSFKHVFDLKNGSNVTGAGEIITIKHEDMETKKKRELIYNITNNKIIGTNNSLKNATLENKKYIYDELLTATAYAEEITNGMFNQKKYLK